MTHAYLLVAVGGFFGALARFLIAEWFSKRFARQSPVATLFVNWLGSFLLGCLIGQQVSPLVNLSLGVGFMGAFTTFSTFKLELLTFVERKQWLFFCGYLMLSYVGGVVLAFGGFLMTNDSFLRVNINMQ